MAILSFPIFAVTFSLAQPVTTTLYGEQYADSALYLALLSVGYYFNAAVGSNGLTLKVFGLLRYVVVINVIAAVVNILLNLLLIPAYGALGAAIGTCSTLILHNLLKQAGLRRAGLPVFHNRYLRVYASIVLAAGALLGVQLAADLPFVAGLALAAVTSAAVIGFNRGELKVAQTFPELLRFRFVRAIVGKS
jgi:O-antigen/teichoic acid export membrane protein